MLANVTTFDCLGDEIDVRLSHKRNPTYRNNDHDKYEPFRNTSECSGACGDMSKAALLKAAAYFRTDPTHYTGVIRDEKTASEWAFVIEQLVGEGSL